MSVRHRGRAWSALWAAALTARLAAPAAGGEWPQYRGADYGGVTKESGWKADWGEDGPKALWKVNVGRGYSSVVVRDNRLYTMGAGGPGRSNQTEVVSCMDVETGKAVWKHEYVVGIRRAGSPVAGTPTLAGKFVYAYGGGADLHCLEADTGKVVWHRDLYKELSAQPVAYGYCASPLVEDGKVIVPVFIRPADGPAGPSAVREPGGGGYPETGGVLMAFDAETGNELWRNTDGAGAWSSPIVGTIDGRRTIVHYSGTLLYGVDPADGRTRWTGPANPDVRSRTASVASSPVLAGNRVLVSAKTGATVGGTACLEVAGGKAVLKWRGGSQEWCLTPVIWQGRMYVPLGAGNVSCVDIETGKVHWTAYDIAGQMSVTVGEGPRRGGGGGNGGAFIIADGKLLLIDHRGRLAVAKVSAEGCKTLATATVLGPDRGYKYVTIPVLLDGRIYCRNTAGELVCLDVRAK